MEYQQRIETETGRKIELRELPDYTGTSVEEAWVYVDCGHRVESWGVFNDQCRETDCEYELEARIAKAQAACDEDIKRRAA